MNGDDSGRRLGRGHGRRWPTAMPGATAAILLVAALALGATTVVPLTLTAATDPTCQDEQGNIIPCDPPPAGGPTATPGEPTPTPGGPTATPGDPAPAPGGGGGDQPTSTPTDKPDPGDQHDPKKDPPPSHRPKPHPELLSLRLSDVSGGVRVDWSVCHRRSFDVYKVVRSTDEQVSWPLGSNDTLVAVIHNRFRTAFVDPGAPVGQRVWYRVFCVNKTADGFKVLGSSRARSIVRAEAAAPKECSFGLEASLTDAGVVLDWGACSSDAFHWYKVVRSRGENPSYVPWTEGSQLIGVIENAATTEFTDTHVESGQTWFYRIQAIGYSNGRKVLLGQTAAVEVSVP